VKILACVCARGGSKGIPGKNLKVLAGKPLIAHSLLTLSTWGKADRTIVSTDSQQIIDTAVAYGAEVPFTRPAELAGDSVAKLTVFQHLVEFCERQEQTRYDYLLDLDATSPLRSLNDIDSVMELMLASDADLVTTGFAARANPYFSMVEIGEDGYASLSKSTGCPPVARQEAPRVLALNGSIWCFRREFLSNAKYHLSGKTLIHEMPDYAIDIDRPVDLEFVNLMIETGRFSFDYTEGSN